MKSLLLDLDDTLLKNRVETFIPAYLQLLARSMQAYVDPQHLIAQLLKGTHAMLANANPEKTLQQAFDEQFYPAMGIPKSELEPRFIHFYRDEFPKLKSLTAPIPCAQHLISYALEEEFEIVIATNPLFPRIAIQERLAWGNLPCDEYPYDLITSYENSHWAKPHLEYFTEILAKLGRNPHEAVMIGNALHDDLLPAQELGLAVFYISEQAEEELPHGSLEEAMEWLRNGPTAPGPPLAGTPKTSLARLRGNLAAFLSMQEEIDLRWESRPAKNNWAPVEVICHLRDVEVEVNLPRLEKVLSAEQPFLSASDSDQWAEQRGYLEENPWLAMQQFIEARKRTLDLLSSQPLEAWERSARHAIFGPTQLIEMVRIFLEHDLVHIRQIDEALHSAIPT